MKIVLWRGFHSPSLLELLDQALQKKILCILCPPHLNRYDFLNFLPAGEVEITGDWEAADRALAEKTIVHRRHRDYPQLPQFGVFTSGTLSFTPTLVLFRKEEAEHSLQSILDLFQPEWAQKIICYPQPFHIFGLTLGYLQSLLWKKPLLTPDGRYQKSFHEVWLKEDRQGLLTLGAPVHFFDLLQRAPDRLSTTRSSAVCGGARVSPELWHEFQHKLGIAYPSVGYGATEACPGLAHLAPGVPPQESGDIGHWLRGVDTRPHEQGYEFRGPNKCFARIEETSPGTFALDFPEYILIKDEVVLSDDRLIYKGRCDLKMNRGGEKFSLELIEETIQRALGVPVLATALPDARLGEKLGLCLQSTNGATDLKTRCREFVAQEFQWVVQEHEMHITEAFPINANGKWDRRQAQSLFKN